MGLSTLVLASSAIACLAFGALAILTRKLGRDSWILGLHTIPLALAAISVAVIRRFEGWTSISGAHSGFSLILLSSLGALAYSRRIGQPSRSVSRFWTFVDILAALSLLVLVILFNVLPEPWGAGTAFAPGHYGYAAACVALFVAIGGLSNTERALRGAAPHVRWEIKFLAIGLLLTLGSTIYVASQAMLHLAVSLRAVTSAAYVYLPASLLMVISWRRSEGSVRIPLSPGLAYSSITFFIVGAYLITSSLVVQWAGAEFDRSTDEQAVLFLLFGALLAAILLSSTFRIRARQWVRENLLAQRFDYREFWHRSLQKVRVRDRVDDAAQALAELVVSAISATEVGVWVRVRGSNRSRICGRVGARLARNDAVTRARIEELEELLDDKLLADLARGKADDRLQVLRDKAGLDLIVTLKSGDECLGLLGVGADGKIRFDTQTVELLGALAEHAANEFLRAELQAERDRHRESEAFQAFAMFLFHDLKNFATTLAMIARNAEEHADKPEFRTQAFRSVFETAEKMQRICGSLRTFSATLAPNREICSIDAIFTKTAAELATALPIDLETDLGRVPHAWLDAEEWSRVFQNLLVNASEASPSGVRVRARSHVVGSSIEFTVSDSGPGIPADFLAESLFVPFKTTKSGGLGVGLYHCKRVVEAHGGRIEVSSEPGRGTAVLIRIPLALPEAAPPRAGERGDGAGDGRER